MSAATWLGAARRELAACASTSDEAARWARDGAPHGALVTALAQTAGRGRHGRAWASPPGAGLYASAVLRPALALGQVPPLTLAIGVGVCDAARRLGAPATLKWPNDVLVGGRKLAGVLVESHSQGARLEAVVVGIGLNLAPVAATHPPELAARATSLADAGARAERAAALEAVLAEVEAWIDRYLAGGLAAIRGAWEARMARGQAGRVWIDGAAVDGELAGLADDGALLLRDPTGRTHRVRSGEVELVAPPEAPDLAQVADPRQDGGEPPR